VLIGGVAMSRKRRKNNFRFTRKILEDLELAAEHLSIAQKEHDISKDIIDRAVARELRVKRNGE